MIHSSFAKGLLGILAMAAMGVFGGGLAYTAYADEGVTSLKMWGCLLLVLVAILGVVASALPLTKRRRLVLSQDELYVEYRRKGRWQDEMRVRWDDITSVDLHRRISGDTSMLDVRLALSPGVQGEGRSPYNLSGYRELPRGLRMSKGALARLVERTWQSRTGA